jgi:predicted GNAT family acetyltransferase
MTTRRAQSIAKQCSKNRQQAVARYDVQLHNERMNTLPDIHVLHDADDLRYLIRVGETRHEDNEVVLRYHMRDANTIDFTSTFTPPSLRGQGLARKVVEHALDEAEGKGLTIIPTCWYVEKIVKERHAEEHVP